MVLSSEFLFAIAGSALLVLEGCSSSPGAKGTERSPSTGSEAGAIPTATATAVGNAPTGSTGLPFLAPDPDASAAQSPGTIAAAGGCGSDGGTSQITVTIRDFKMYTVGGTNPDFENVTGPDKGIVSNTLGTDGKPVYANAAGTTRTTHGKMYFDQWYNDVPGVNINVQYPVPLTNGPGGTCGYDSLSLGVPNAATGTNGWFPIDDGTPYATRFGNQGLQHNYSFTTEIHTVFVYRGGETFSFSGDDDVFVFIDNKLVIDLGGVHTREQGSVALDSLGFTVGQQYPLDLFNAERHTVDSNFSFTTTLRLQPAPPPQPH